MTNARTTLYLTRHGETEWNVAGKLQGHQDSPLTDLGKRQAQWLAVHLKDIELDAIYSSASPRAMHTAEIIRDQRDFEIYPCKSLMEINMGTWEGKALADIEREYRDGFYKFWNDPHAFLPTNGGEDFVLLQDRLIPQVNQIISKHNGGNVLIVTHAVALKVIMAYFKGDPLEQLWGPPIMQPTALSKVVIDDASMNIELHGDVSHYRTVRRAVGAIARYGNKFILVHKTSNTFREPPGVWDFPKGGVEEKDLSLEDALLRELREETGTDKYRIIEELPEKISLNFNEDVVKRVGYERQETTMFLVEFTGNEQELIPADHEISEITLVEPEALLAKLSHEETAEYVRKYCSYLLTGRT